MHLSKTTKSQRISNAQFFARYPGPFVYEAGQDGVDETFDIYCVTTAEYIYSTRYWDDHEEAERTAKAITDALNLLARSFETIPAPS